MIDEEMTSAEIAAHEASADEGLITETEASSADETSWLGHDLDRIPSVEVRQ